jgi:mannose-1-phosphate guanylyltransferase
MPKQFIDFFGVGKTQLQSTFERMAGILPSDNIYVCTTREYLHWVREQLPQLKAEHILTEPVNRNTAPSVAWAGARIHRECEDARLVVVPSDQFIIDEEAFRRNVLEGLDFVADNDIMLTMGIRPSRPEPGYGYIQMGEATLSSDIYKVQSFTEKPERDFARVFMESGEFLWNTGMFLSNLRHLRRFFMGVITDMPLRLGAIKDMKTVEETEHFVEQCYPAYPNLSMDEAALERSDAAYVMRCDFGWADLGTWHSIYECMQKTEDENVVINSEVMLEDCKNNIIKLPSGHVGVIQGLDGYIIAEQGDVLLICQKGDSSSLIRKYVNEVGIRYGQEYV